jgi:hypothetical protein
MRKLVLFVPVLIMSIILCSSAFAIKGTHEVNTGSVTGQIVVKGQGPMSGGTVFFFDEVSGPPPSATKYWRVPTHAFKVDENGKFKAVLPEGKYYMGASKKLSGEPLGPPQDGDFFFISQDEKGNPKLHAVRKNEVIDMGIISEAVPFSKKTLVREGITSIEGTILNEKGKPVEGIIVFAFSTPTMVGRPLFVSYRSDKDGKYLLRLHAGGTYYLKARVNYEGGPPSADQIMGVYRDGQPLTIKTGETKKGIDIKVTRVGVSKLTY